MYSLNISQDGNTFKIYFQNGRMRKYHTLSIALNGAVHLLNNPKNKLQKIVIYNVDTKNREAIITKDSNGRPSVEYMNIMDAHKENIVTIDSLIVKPQKTDRTEFLIDCYKRYQSKKFNNRNITYGDSLNNIADIDNITYSNDDSYSTFMAVVIEKSIKSGDYRTLFNTEVKLSQKGYSWYPDSDNVIQVKPTPLVLEYLNRYR